MTLGPCSWTLTCTQAPGGVEIHLRSSLATTCWEDTGEREVHALQTRAAHPVPPEQSGQPDCRGRLCVQEPCSRKQALSNITTPRHLLCLMPNKIVASEIPLNGEMGFTCDAPGAVCVRSSTGVACFGQGVFQKAPAAPAV